MNQTNIYFSSKHNINVYDIYLLNNIKDIWKNNNENENECNMISLLKYPIKIEQEKIKNRRIQMLSSVKETFKKFYDKADFKLLEPRKLTAKNSMQKKI